MFCLPAVPGENFVDSTSSSIEDMLDDILDDDHYYDDEEEVTVDINKEFILFALEHCESVLRLSNSPLDNDIWENTPDDLKNDPDVAASALKHKVCQVAELPEKFQNDHAFLRKVVQDDLSLWHSLPDAIKSDVNFMCGLSHYSDLYILEGILEQVPALCGEYHVWQTVIKSTCHVQENDDADWPIRELRDLLMRHAPPEILANGELMLEAVGSSANIYPLIDNHLFRDQEFLKRLLKKNPSVLAQLSHETQRLFPELVSKTFASYFETIFQREQSDTRCMIEESEAMARSIVSALWENRNVVRGWFSAGAALFHDTIFPESWRSDAELFLWIAKHTGQHSDLCCRAADAHCLLGRSFGKASPSLRNDMDFMKRAVQYNSAVFSYASERLQGDMDLAIYAAASSSGDFCRQFLEHCPLRANRDFLWQVRNQVDEQLGLQSTFICEIVGTIDARKHHCYHHYHGQDDASKQQQQNDDASSPLALLNQGSETTIVYKKLIGEYVGVPSGHWLQILRRASKYLHRPNDLLYLRTCHDWDGDAARDAEEDDERGIAVKSMALVMRQTKCSRAEAVRALRENNHDLVDTVMSLTKNVK